MCTKCQPIAITVYQRNQNAFYISNVELDKHRIIHDVKKPIKITDSQEAMADFY